MDFQSILARITLDMGTWQTSRSAADYSRPSQIVVNRSSPPTLPSPNLLPTPTQAKLKWTENSDLLGVPELYKIKLEKAWPIRLPIEPTILVLYNVK